ncbi:hypothetical protein ADL22_09000 [Streptomyces sp. NRRL F-4489]|uniref:hypothetical protein n=1 Tax=Streptomyces sp. NRRL F-4489 TaxID=1609095 RepID=UPI00074AB72A|nr:hypothetical protein [Streptomyces sp. NRRL F-4489]KUL49093.1 hypothetical protein ADL22_09000 [Streptomyces sp. NRRL F-4489]
MAAQSQVDTVARKIGEEFGGIHVLVNSSATAHRQGDQRTGIVHLTSVAAAEAKRAWMHEMTGA